MQPHSRRWTNAKMIGDAILINLAIALAWFIRYDLLDAVQLGEGFFPQPYTAYIPISIGLTAITIFTFRMEGLYVPARGRSLFEEIYMLIKGTTPAILLMMAITFFARPLVYSRAVYVFGAILIVVFLGAERTIEYIVRARLRKRGIGVNRVLIVGAGEAGRALMRTIVAQPRLAYHVVGFVDDDPERGTTDIGRFRALGGTGNLPQLLRELSVDEVIVTLPWSARDKIIRIMEIARRLGITSKVVPDLFQLSLSRVMIDDVGGVPLIGLRETKMGTINAAFKRLFDVVFGIALTILAAPLMLLIAVLIRLDSPGPVIFLQKRIGRNGNPFVAYKFRSMVEGAEEEQAKLNGLNEASAPLFKIREDPRRTRVGRVLRRMSLDEIPQIFNVLRGEMSLVGPRPPIESEVEQYQEWHKQRLQVSPGITGLWQVSGRSELTFDEMVMLDIHYIENWSPWLDLYILAKTIPTVLFGRGAY